MLRAQGLSLEIAAVIGLVAFLKTGLAEEIFFRGLIAKRLIGWLGLAAGNSIQAAIFGAVHLLIFAVPGGPELTLPFVLLVFSSPALMGAVMAYLNEAVGNGSIAPSWLLHGLGNAAAYPVLAFG